MSRNLHPIASPTDTNAAESSCIYRFSLRMGEGKGEGNLQFIHAPGNGMIPLNFAIVFSRSSRLERLTLGNLSFQANGRTA